MSQNFCSINQNENKNKNFLAPHSNEAEPQTQPQTRWQRSAFDGPRTCCKKPGTDRQGEWDKEGRQQKVSTAKGATDEQVKRKTIANYGSSHSSPFACLPLLSTPGNTLSQHKNRKQKKTQRDEPGKTMRKITFVLINFNNKNLNAFDTKQATVPKTRLNLIKIGEMHKQGSRCGLPSPPHPTTQQQQPQHPPFWYNWIGSQPFFYPARETIAFLLHMLCARVWLRVCMCVCVCCRKSCMISVDYNFSMNCGHMFGLKGGFCFKPKAKCNCSKITLNLWVKTYV